MTDLVNQHTADGPHVPGQRPGTVIRATSQASLLAVIPLLLNFVPSEPSIVVVGTTGPSSAVALTLRYDIPDPAGAATVARHATELLSAQDITSAYVVGYGTAEAVDPVAGALRAHLAGAGIRLAESLRASGGRYWSGLCTDPACCPPEGTPFSLETHPLTRGHAGQVLASREALASTVAPVTGEDAVSMRRATGAARRRAARLAAGAGPDERAGRRAVREAGLAAVRDAVSLYRGGGRLESHAEAARLLLSLQGLQVRDDAWARMLPEHRRAHLRLWTDLTTLARPGYAAAPATLLAFCAWQDGDGALANVALDRAIADNPQYSMARLIRTALDGGAPPSMARLPMTPEEVADSYAAAEDAQDPAGDAGPGGPTEGSAEAGEAGAGATESAQAEAPA